MVIVNVIVNVNVSWSVAAVVPLPTFNASLDEITVSGLSSGAFFSVQMHLAYSSWIQGAAIFAGGPYDCAQGSITTAELTCMNAISPPIATTYILIADIRASDGKIDNTTNLEKDKVFMFSGTLDSTVKPIVMDCLYKFYSNYIEPANVLFVYNMTAAHTQPTDDPLNTNPCWLSSPPYLSNCNYDGAGIALNHLLGNLNPRNEGTLNGDIIEFDQTPFAPNNNPASLSMSNSGYAFVPKACSQGEACKIHISFHGCAQNYGSVKTAYIDRSGYNKWADTNNIVILYPQTIASDLFPLNPEGCWDWWGYASDATNYDTNTGPQMEMIKAIAEKATKNHMRFD